MLREIGFLTFSLDEFAQRLVALRPSSPRPSAATVDRQTTLDRLVQVTHQLVHSLALGGAARNSGYLGPKAAFLRLMHHDLDLHADMLLSAKYARDEGIQAS